MSAKSSLPSTNSWLAVIMSRAQGDLQVERLVLPVYSSAPSQTVLLTGGTSGIGYACARTIAASRPDWRLVIASRNERHGTQAVTTLKHQTGNQQIE